jgi:hypothetical protein
MHRMCTLSVSICLGCQNVCSQKITAIKHRAFLILQAVGDNICCCLQEKMTATQALAVVSRPDSPVVLLLSCCCVGQQLQQACKAHLHCFFTAARSHCRRLPRGFRQWQQQQRMALRDLVMPRQQQQQVQCQTACPPGFLGLPVAL